MMTITGFEHQYHTDDGKKDGKKLFTTDVWTIDEAGVKRRFTQTALVGKHSHATLVANAEKACMEGVERINQGIKERANG